VANPDRYTLTFYRSDITKNALTPIQVAWAGYRWAVIPG
jgi:hypothetical protein